MDRTYWKGAKAWHAMRLTRLIDFRALCGRTGHRTSETSDRVPADGHLCGSCARSIAAATDVEE